jgi:hypothetical protein
MGGYTYKHGVKDDYVLPSLAGLKERLKEAKETKDNQVINMIRLIVHNDLFED